MNQVVQEYPVYQVNQESLVIQVNLAVHENPVYQVYQVVQENHAYQVNQEN